MIVAFLRSHSTLCCDSVLTGPILSKSLSPILTSTTATFMHPLSHAVSRQSPDMVRRQVALLLEPMDSARRSGITPSASDLQQFALPGQIPRNQVSTTRVDHSLPPHLYLPPSTVPTTLSAAVPPPAAPEIPEISELCLPPLLPTATASATRQAGGVPSAQSLSRLPVIAKFPPPTETPSADHSTQSPPAESSHSGAAPGPTTEVSRGKKRRGRPRRGEESQACTRMQTKSLLRPKRIEMQTQDVMRAAKWCEEELRGDGSAFHTPAHVEALNIEVGNHAHFVRSCFAMLCVRKVPDRIS